MLLQHDRKLDDWVKLHKAYPEHAELRKAVAAFRATVKAADWRGEADLMKTFKNADCTSAPTIGFVLAPQVRVMADVQLSTEEEIGSLVVKWIGRPNGYTAE